MTKTTQSRRESEMPTTKFENVVDATPAITQTPCRVFEFPQPEGDEVPASYTSIDDLVNELESDAGRKAAIEKGRWWVAETFYGDDGATVRTMRLKKGWSQAVLAKEIGTSQSHVARIERGTENLAIRTCRKLCNALEIDMNTLDLALQRQEGFAQAKTK